jgi:hypothetical protein
MFKCEYAHRIAACDGLGWIIPFLSLADCERYCNYCALSNFVSSLGTEVINTWCRIGFKKSTSHCIIWY